MSDKFWDNIEETTGEFDSGGGGFELIPEGTNVLAVLTEAEWTLYNGDEYISTTWEVLKPDAYKNRKVWQKIRVLDDDVKKSDKAKKMLAAIDKNASGGKLIALGRKPTDTDLMKCLSGKQMVLKLGVWEMNGKQGNWVQAVAPKTGAAIPEAKPKPTTPAHDVNAEYDDDIAF